MNIEDPTKVAIIMKLLSKVIYKLETEEGQHFSEIGGCVISATELYTSFARLLFW